MNNRVYLIGSSTKTNHTDWINKQHYTLSSWLAAAAVDIDDTIITNESQLSNSELYNIALDVYQNGSKVLAFGRIASNRLHRNHVKHLYLPHPSNLNTTVNDQKYEAVCLDRMKYYLGYGFDE